LNRSLKKEERRKKKEERRKKEEERRKKEEGRRKKEEGRRKIGIVVYRLQNRQVSRILGLSGPLCPPSILSAQSSVSTRFYWFRHPKHTLHISQEPNPFQIRRKE